MTAVMNLRIQSLSLPAFLLIQNGLKKSASNFFRNPQLIGFSGTVSEPNSFMTVECMGIPIVVTRNEFGELKAFINACSHRGARVADGTGIKNYELWFSWMDL